MSSTIWDKVSEPAKNLVRGLLEMDPEKRLSAEQALNSEWIKKLGRITLDGTEALDGSQDQSNILVDALNNMKIFQKHRKLRKSIISVIAKRLPDDEEIKKVRNLFISLDEDKDGYISLSALKESLSKNSAVNSAIGKDLANILKEADSNNDNIIDINEFVQSAARQSLLMKETYLLTAFLAFDKNGNGLIDRNELANALDNDHALVSEIFKEGDIDGDGEISFEEFSNVVKNMREAAENRL